MALFGVNAVELEQRYFKSNGEPINLAQTTGHLRLELTKIKKTKEPVPIDDALLEIGCDRKALAEASLDAESELKIDDVTHCPINKKGEKVKAHIFQTNLEDNAYVSEMYVGNPPQLIRALFDTGSTNTWVLNS